MLRGKSLFPLHRKVTATVFWVGEPAGGGGSERNAVSAWDDEWQKHYGCFDDPYHWNGYFPAGCTPQKNSFYNSLPYNDLDDNGSRRSTAVKVVPWATWFDWTGRSMLKNQCVKISRGRQVCYSQVEDVGPYVDDDDQYVFQNTRPKNTLAHRAGLDVSPAVRDCLGFNGLNNDVNTVRLAVCHLFTGAGRPVEKDHHHFAAQLERVRILKNFEPESLKFFIYGRVSRHSSRARKIIFKPV